MAYVAATPRAYIGQSVGSGVYSKGSQYAANGSMATRHTG